MWLYFVSFLLAILLGAILVSNGVIPPIKIQIDCRTSIHWCGR